MTYLYLTQPNLKSRQTTDSPINNLSSSSNKSVGDTDPHGYPQGLQMLHGYLAILVVVLIIPLGSVGKI